MYLDKVNYRRTMDNRFFAKSRKRINGETIRFVDPVSPEFADELIRRARLLLQKIEPQVPENMINLVQKILHMDMSELKKSADEFHRVYLPISVLPPDQYMSLVLQITEGCNYNQCLFCNFYRDRPFRIKSLDEVKQHITDVRRFFGEGIKLRKSIFLSDANALVIPQDKIIPTLREIKEQLPEFHTFYSFIDVFTGIKKSEQNFSSLKDLGIKRVYLGVESGNEKLLDLLKKTQSIDSVIQLTRRIKDSGINIGVIFLAGVGGRSYFTNHLRDSIQLIKNIPLSRTDIVYISEFYDTSEEYRLTLQNLDISRPERLEIREMAREFKQAIKEVVPKDVSVSIYDIQQFFY